MKAVKRVRYGEKEAKMLNKIVEGAKQRREEMEKEHQPQPLGEEGTILYLQHSRAQCTHENGTILYLQHSRAECTHEEGTTGHPP